MGDGESWNAVLTAEAKVADGQKAGRYLSDPEESDLPPIYQRVGNVGVISIEGSLINGSAGWMRLFGVMGYTDILAAVMEAVGDDQATSLLFKVSSGGGHVHGLAEFSAHLTKLSAEKPSLTYTADTMASAAYWAGSSVNGPIMMAPTAEVGSLGVLLVTKNVSKMLEMEGIAVTIHRAGEMKARINPFEDITPEAKAHLDSQLADLHSMFKKHVGSRRPSMAADDLAAATDGRTFLGKRAIDAKLADSLGSLDMALKLLDKSSRKKDTPSNSKGASMNMTPAQLARFQAALAGGATIEAALQAAGVVATAEQIAELTQARADFAASEEAAAAAKKATDDAAAATAAAATAAAAAAAVAVGGDKSAELVTAHAQIDLLKSQLVAAQASAATASNKLAVLEASTQSDKANAEGLLAIARKATAHMMIPMGGSATSADAMDAATVIAEHARIEKLFMAKFPVGQQSKQEPDDKAQAGVPLAFSLRTQQPKSK